ncbi:Uncharacterised protein [Pasteurella bettyae]|nr:Uncharacterised protein [Pasteurella bettyae]
MPLGSKGRSNTLTDDYRELLIMPFIDQGKANMSIFDDDGVSFDYLNGKHLTLDIELNCSSKAIEINITKKGHYEPQYKELVFTLPHTEQRQLIVNGKSVESGYKLPISEI